MIPLLAFAAACGLVTVVVAVLELLTEPPAEPEPFTPLADMFHRPRHAAPQNPFSAWRN